MLCRNLFSTEDHVFLGMTQSLCPKCLALVLTGVVLGQLIRRVRSLAQDYADRLGTDQGRAS